MSISSIESNSFTPGFGEMPKPHVDHDPFLDTVDHNYEGPARGPITGQESYAQPRLDTTVATLGNLSVNAQQSLDANWGSL